MPRDNDAVENFTGMFDYKIIALQLIFFSFYEIFYAIKPFIFTCQALALIAGKTGSAVHHKQHTYTNTKINK
jgi:hypothetical protein